MKGPSRKQVIISMNDNNKKNFIEKSSGHVTNMNSILKNIKSDIMVNFIQGNPKGIITVTNKVASSLNLQTIENYIKNANCINVKGVDIPRLLQSKSYLKIISISHLQKRMLILITLSMVEEIIKGSYIFNNIVLASKPCIIKVSPKLDMSII